MKNRWILWILVSLLSSTLAAAAGPEGVEASYHGQMGLGTGLGMLEKWCALPNFSFEQQGGIEGWTAQSCNGCHIGAAWNPTRPVADCTFCHTSANPTPMDRPTIERCLTCHVKDTAKRGDVFSAEADVHIAAGMVCQDCHLRVTDELSDHQLLKGTAFDTTEPTMQGTLDCATCHTDAPHQQGARADQLNAHVATVACETCHTGLRPAAALMSRKWNEFTVDNKPITAMRSAGWKPRHKWYDNLGPGAAGDYHLPILGPTERRDAPGARIYPFNPVTVTWFVKTPESSFDDVITVPEVKAADVDLDHIVTLEEMRLVYPGATLETEDMTFSINHSVLPADQAFVCNDCHGANNWLLDWDELFGLFNDGFESGDLSRWTGSAS